MPGHLAAQEGAVPHPERDQDLLSHGVFERRTRDPGQQQSEKLVTALDAAGIELIGDNAVSSVGGRGVRRKRP